MDDAVKNDEMIAISESTVIRFIDEINNTNSNEIYEKVSQYRKELKYLKKQEKTHEVREKTILLYKKIDEILFMPEYFCLDVDTDSDYVRACQGFYVNGFFYKRLLGTTGGIKNNTIVFLAEVGRNGDEVRNEIVKRIDNGRNLSKPLVPAKLEAYKALACSASTVVSEPRGVVVVDDCITKFKSDYIMIDDKDDGEPLLSNVFDGDVELNCSDGFGFISPKLAEKWSIELGFKESLSGFCIRNSFCKGMLFPFDYIEFGNSIANTTIIKDAWGQCHDINEVEIILTTSMLKLWDSYENICDYLSNCKKNNYKFSVTKVCDPVEKNSRELNYQFLQSYKLSEDEIFELAKPTLDDICGILGGDFHKTMLFLNGESKGNVLIDYGELSYSDALMCNSNVINDPCLRGRVTQMIDKKISNAKLGRIRVNGDYFVISGDPYSLCQSMFGLEVTGILEAGQIYSNYWLKRNADEVVCFRAPMSCHNNIRKVKVAKNCNADYWYKYMKNVLILNSWDMITFAANGCDFDGDTFLATDNPILLKNTLDLPAIVCVQRKADKKVVTENDLITSNIAGFGDSIGSITNKVTAMFEVQAGFKENSEEYKILDYRIMCGQLYQQNEIDRLKGVKAKPMPEYWYDEVAAKERDKDNPNNIKNIGIVASKRPLFMNYRYAQQLSSYNKYIKDVKTKCVRMLGKNIEAILSSESLTKKECNFVEWYYKKMPVGIGNCTSNILCGIVEDFISLQNNTWKESVSGFDYTIYKSGVEYSKYQLKEIRSIYERYQSDWIDIVVENKRKHFDAQVIAWKKACLTRDVKKKLDTEFNDDVLCDVLLDITYGSGKPNPCVWDFCGNKIVENLLEKSDRKMFEIKREDGGQIHFQGDDYEIYEVQR